MIAEWFPVHAAIDVSDGLSLDLSRLARASGVAAWIDPEKVPIHDDAFRAAAAAPGGRTPLDRALGDGEDFELLLAMPADAAEELLAAAPNGMELARIGGIVEGDGIHLRKPDGSLAPLPATGFLHRFDGEPR